MLAINDHYHAWFYMAVILTLTVLNTLIHLFKVLPTSCTTPWLWNCFVAHNCECYFSRRVSIRERKDIETIWHMLSIFIIHPNRHNHIISSDRIMYHQFIWCICNIPSQSLAVWNRKEIWFTLNILHLKNLFLEKLKLSNCWANNLSLMKLKTRNKIIMSKIYELYHIFETRIH